MEEIRFLFRIIMNWTAFNLIINERFIESVSIKRLIMDAGLFSLRFIVEFVKNV